MLKQLDCVRNIDIPSAMKSRLSSVHLELKIYLALFLVDLEELVR